MKSSSTESAHSYGGGGPSGLSLEQKAALGRATDMIAQGHTQEEAVAHLVTTGMPKVVAKVLVKQLDKRS